MTLLMGQGLGTDQSLAGTTNATAGLGAIVGVFQIIVE